jgi:hypothetical protein
VLRRGTCAGPVVQLPALQSSYCIVSCDAAALLVYLYQRLRVTGESYKEEQPALDLGLRKPPYWVDLVDVQGIAPGHVRRAARTSTRRLSVCSLSPHTVYLQYL